MSDTPIWDALMEERGGRLPHQFEGHEEWEGGPEAAAAFARGVSDAKTQAQAKPGQSRGPGISRRRRPKRDQRRFTINLPTEERP